MCVWRGMSYVRAAPNMGRGSTGGRAFGLMWAWIFDAADEMGHVRSDDVMA